MPTSLSPFHLVGVSHHTADVSLRERLSPKGDELASWLGRAGEVAQTLVVLATCNRFELYWWGDDDQEFRLCGLAQDRGFELGPSVMYRRDGAAALHHLFTVASGLDSQILGETEILGQVRRAHELAHECGATTWELDAAFTAALAAGRRARRETMLGRHPASVSGAALLQAKICCGGSLAGKHVLLVGAGEAAEGVLRGLQTEGAGSVVVLNRHAERASLLVSSWNASAGSWDDLAGGLAAADVVITATAAPAPILSVSALETALLARPESPLVIIDLAVPRNVDPAARDLPGLRLFDLDDLQLQYCPATMIGAVALEEGERIVREELTRFRDTLKSRAAAPRLAELHRLGAELAREEADRVLEQLASLNEQEREAVRRMADRLARRLLYPASRKIREGEL